MADEPTGAKPEPPKLPPEYPGTGFPVAFADGVMSASWDRGVVKFYFARSDPEFRATAPGKEVPVAQVVMPDVGFIQMCHFFDRILKRMVSQDYVKQELIDLIRSFDDARGEPKNAN